MWKRLHTFYVKCYEHVRMWLERHDPKPRTRENDTLTMPWEPGDNHHCSYCIWQWLDWYEDARPQRWRCSHCGLSIYPKITVTEKRPVVRPPEPVVRSLITLPEQIAVQPPQAPHVFALKREPNKEDYVPGRYLKAVTGPLELRDGKPYYKNGVRVTTEQFKRIIYPPRNDRRTG